MGHPLTWCPLVRYLMFCIPRCSCRNIQGVQMIRSIGYLFILTIIKLHYKQQTTLINCWTPIVQGIDVRSVNINNSLVQGTQ